MAIGTFIKDHPENIAGIISLAGSSALLLAGNSQSAVATAIFTAAELTLARYGGKSAGYSAGAALFAAGDLTLAFSGSVEHGSALQVSLLAMTAAWATGALRYPFEQAAKSFNKPQLQNMADALPAICGTGNLALRLPALFSAAMAQNYIVTGAIAAWGVADILAGRIQERAAKIYASLKSDTKKPPEPRRTIL